MSVLPTLGRVDAVVTDPPYSDRTHQGHDATSVGHIGFNHDGFNRSPLNYAAWDSYRCTAFANAICDACVSWLVIMHDHAQAPWYHDALSFNGRYVFAPIPYYAPGSRCRLSGDGPSSWTIWITVARTAKQSRWGTLPGGYLAQPGWRDVEYIGGKPTRLMMAIVQDYSRPGDVVCDPCMGYGTTGVACLRTGRSFIGIEVDESAFEAACERIQKAYDNRALFNDLPEPEPEQGTLFDEAVGEGEGR